GRVQQPDCALNRRGTQVHVPLRGAKVLMSGELLNRSCRRTTHRQVRTERVPQAMHAVLVDARASCRAFDVMLFISCLLFDRETRASTTQSDPLLLPTRNGPCRENGALHWEYLF